MHEFLTRGIRSVTYTDQYGAVQNPTIRLLDKRDPENNDFMAARQVTVVEGDRRRRFDVVLLLHGVFGHARFLDLVTGYVAFARTDGGLLERLAKPHQYFAVAEAVRKTIEAVRGDGRAGVVWHTQGSGKSMEMEKGGLRRR